MEIRSGSKLGPYEILELIGKGGMGEVWRSRDSRLDRDVAIKIVSERIAHDKQVMARFEREARVISSLSHANICTLFDVGQENGRHYLVMELIDGESLASRLKRGAMPIHEVLQYGAQIASALDRAHRQGIVHRDLKPGNVMLTTDGAKLCDFGLARTLETQAPIEGLSTAATRDTPLTAAGSIVGTFQYMAPEQLEGVETDARTDIFAFGALLYEMASGHPAFEGKSKTSLIAAIVASEPPPMTADRAAVPPALDHVVRGCLQKEPDHRWQSAHDVARQLQWIADVGSRAGEPAAVVSTRRRRRKTLVLAAMLGWAAAVLLLVWALGLRTSGRASQVLRAELVDRPAWVQLGTVALSPDGNVLAFIHEDTSQNLAISVRDLTTGEVRQLAGTEGATFPFWSPDARWLGFFAGEKLKKVKAAGGSVLILADAHDGRGGTWSHSGAIVFAPDILGPLRMVSENGSADHPVSRPSSEQRTHRMPHFLPNGRDFLFVDRDSREESVGRIMLGTLDDTTTRLVVERASNPQVADGYLFFVRDGILVARRFDAADPTAESPLIPVADALEYYNPRDIGNFSVTSSGMLVYRQREANKTQLGWAPLDGSAVELIGEPYHFTREQLGAGITDRDVSVVALVRDDTATGTSDIWTMDLARGKLTRATFETVRGGITASPSANGERLVVSSFGSGNASAVWIQRLSGTGPREIVIEGTDFIVAGWSQDGRYLIGGIQQNETGQDLAYIDLQGSSEPVLLVSTRYEEVTPHLSPDGKWLAFQSNETGQDEVFVTDFPEGLRKWQASDGGGRAPVWGSEGNVVYYLGAGGMFAVTVGGEGARQFGAPQKVSEDFSSDLSGGAGVPIAVVDGRVLRLGRRSDATGEPLRLIRNWQAAIAR